MNLSLGLKLILQMTSNVPFTGQAGVNVWPVCSQNLSEVHVKSGCISPALLGFYLGQFINVSI